MFKHYWSDKEFCTELSFVEDKALIMSELSFWDLLSSRQCNPRSNHSKKHRTLSYFL